MASYSPRTPPNPLTSPLITHLSTSNPTFHEGRLSQLTPPTPPTPTSPTPLSPLDPKNEVRIATKLFESRAPTIEQELKEEVRELEGKLRREERTKGLLRSEVRDLKSALVERNVELRRAGEMGMELMMEVKELRKELEEVWRRLAVSEEAARGSFVVVEEKRDGGRLETVSSCQLRESRMNVRQALRRRGQVGEDREKDWL